MAALFVHPLEDATFAAFLKDATLPQTVTGILANPSVASCSLVAILMAISYAVQLTGYWSVVDRLWSIVPFVYAGIYAAFNSGNQRAVLIAALTTVWGLRLTFNFWRKGGYAHEEDYRWPIIRKWFADNDPTHPFGRELFSLLFVAIYQHILLWLIAGPAAFVATIAADGGALTTLDYALAGAFLTALSLEFLTDEQQWAFQTQKYALKAKGASALAKAGGDFVRGFRTTGAFAVSRHLNFFCEQSLWWIVYGFTITSGSALVNWTVVGPFLLSLLFLGSTDMTERLTAAKYGAAYAAYQRTTSRLVPWFPGTSLDSAEGQKLIASLEAEGKASKKAK